MKPYDPAVVGNRRWVRLGRGTGPAGVRSKLEELRLVLPEDRIPAAVEAINRHAIEKKRAVSDEEFRALVDVLSGGATRGG